MTLTLKLSPEAEQILRERADRVGASLESYVAGLLEKEVRNGSPVAKSTTWQELSAPLAEALGAGGMTDNEFAGFVEEVRQEVWQGPRAKPTKKP